MASSVRLSLLAAPHLLERVSDPVGSGWVILVEVVHVDLDWLVALLDAGWAGEGGGGRVLGALGAVLGVRSRVRVRSIIVDYHLLVYH